MTNQGTDLLLTDGFEPHFPLCSQRKNLAAALFRRCTTDPASDAGKAIYDGQCYDARAFFAGKLDVSRLGLIGPQVARACLQDERVLKAVGVAAYSTANKKLEITVTITDADGPFSFIVAITSVTAEVLTNGF